MVKTQGSFKPISYYIHSRQSENDTNITRYLQKDVAKDTKIIKIINIIKEHFRKIG